MYNPKTQKPRGFGFVTFKYSDEADKVITAEHVIDEKKVMCNFMRAVVWTAEQSGASVFSIGAWWVFK